MDAPPASLPPRTAACVAGRWPRLAAALLDVLFLAMVAAIVGMLAGERIAPAGTPGRLWGLFVVVPYLAFFGSRHGGGQTFGKTWLHIRVVNAEGQPLSLVRSGVRALVLAAPWFVNGLRYSKPTFAATLSLRAFSVLVLGVGVASVVTFFLSRRAHQAVHDLLVGSYVVEESTLARPVAARTRLGLVAVAATWMVLVLVGTTFQLRHAFAPPAENPMMDQLTQLPGVSTVLINTVTLTPGWGGDGERRPRNVVRVQVWYRGPENQRGPLTHAVASVVLWNAPLAFVSEMQVTLTKGWDLGMASWTTVTTEKHSLDEWRAAD